MNRTEALNILGLEEDASPEEIKTAYRETAQILHPDRFASNKKLQDRATEQFKHLQEAYDFLCSSMGARKNAASSRTSAAGRTTSGCSPEVELEARLAGVAAARTQLVKQRDAVLDERRNALCMIAVGGVVALLLRRMVAIAGIASAAAVWGIVQFVSSQRTLNTLDEHIADLKKEQKKLQSQLEEL